MWISIAYKKIWIKKLPTCYVSLLYFQKITIEVILGTC